MKIFSKIKDNSFFHSILLISGSTAIGQILSIICMPIITRLYTPEDFGVLSLFISILTPFSFIMSLKIELAIPIAKNDSTAINIIKLCLLLITIISISLFLITIFFESDFLSIFNAQSFIGFSFFIPLSLIFMGCFNVFLQWLYRHRLFKQITLANILKSFSLNVCKILFGYIGFTSLGLIYSFLISQIISFLTLLKSFDVSKLSGRLDLVNSYKLLEINKFFIFFSTPAQLLGSISASIPILMLSKFFGDEITGLFGLSYSLINVPISLIGTSVGRVFYSEVAFLSRTDPKRIKLLSNKLIKKLTLISILVSIIIFFGGPILFSHVFGDKWQLSGKFAKSLILAMASNMIFIPVSQVFTIFEKQHLSLFIDIVRIFLILCVFFISSYLSLNPYLTIFIYSLNVFFIHFLTYIIANKIIDSQIKNFILKF
jgi:O-antigen/teichoic acid export membrane protein